MKFQMGPVNSSSTTTNAAVFEARTRNELGTLFSSARSESYQIFSTEERCVMVLTGERIRRMPPRNKSPAEVFRKRRPEVSTGGQAAKKRPCRFNAKAKPPSSLQ